MKVIPLKVRQELAMLENITDALGKGIDKEIRLLVAVLRCHGFVTDMSCAGHIHRKSVGPYVTVEAPEAGRLTQILMEGPDEGPKFLANMKAVDKSNQKERLRLFAFLKSFYNDRQTSYATTLRLSKYGAGPVRLNCIGADVMTAPKYDRSYAEYVKGAQAEMQAFAEFLCDQL